MRRWMALAVSLLIAGCTAAPPITYLRLAPVPGPTLTATGTPVTVAHVVMPPVVDRLALVTETGESTLETAENANWAAPLDEMATTVLAQDLASRLPRIAVLMPGEVLPSGGVRTVRVDVLRFLPVNGASRGYVALDADWQVLSAPGTVTESGRSGIRVPRAPGAPAAAAAMSTALGRLADRIAAALARG